MDQNFVNYIKSHIKDYLPSKFVDSKVITREIVKGNDEKLTALLISKHEGESVPTIYLDDYYEEYQSGRSLEEILKEMAYLRVDQDEVMNFDPNSLLDYNFSKSMLSLRLYDKDKNKDFLKDKPYTELGGFVITYRIQPISSKKGKATFAIDNHLLEIFNISLNQLHDEALKVEKNREEVIFCNLKDFSVDNYKNLFYKTEPLEPTAPMYLLSNSSFINGAAVIALEGVLDKIGYLLGSDYYILPASINELIIYPATGPAQVQDLKATVNYANKVSVDDHDYLSDKIHYYNRKTKELTQI